MSIFGLLKKKQPKFEDRPDFNPQRSKKTNMIEKGPDPILQMMSGISDDPEKATMNTYDIVVFEKTLDGTTKQTAVNGVKAASPRDLIAMYAADGSRVQILKEYGPDGKPFIQPRQTQQQRLQTPASSSPTLFPQTSPTQSSKNEKEPPKFFEIGGVKCKLEDGKMYQEQWVRVDSTKYRLIADSTNKVASMNGKHLETLKWVQIEDGEEKENG